MLLFWRIRFLLDQRHGTMPTFQPISFDKAITFWRIKLRAQRYTWRYLLTKPFGSDSTGYITEALEDFARLQVHMDQRDCSLPAPIHEGGIAPCRSQFVRLAISLVVASHSSNPIIVQTLLLFTIFVHYQGVLSLFSRFLYSNRKSSTARTNSSSEVQMANLRTAVGCEVLELVVCLLVDACVAASKDDETPVPLVIAFVTADVIVEAVLASETLPLSDLENVYLGLHRPSIAFRFDHCCCSIQSIINSNNTILACRH
ncbi:hypothetical protein K431DRAFT_124599 [Polychaeton citri CBS 116435]|uniref:Uncharacterized protein n=1 Tax=Polychaeton citri CBS 116435 TaxID=1314669 RepID=A0A9P4Q6B7_9PEZI|nr:hypothetical protein K431DRAFT_124599 [Polychaeton citri CBS 116435]